MQCAATSVARAAVKEERRKFSRTFAHVHNRTPRFLRAQPPRSAKSCRQLELLLAAKIMNRPRFFLAKMIPSRYGLNRTTSEKWTLERENYTETPPLFIIRLLTRSPGFSSLIRHCNNWINYVGNGCFDHLHGFLTCIGLNRHDTIFEAAKVGETTITACTKASKLLHAFQNFRTDFPRHRILANDSYKLSIKCYNIIHCQAHYRFSSFRWK